MIQESKLRSIIQREILRKHILKEESKRVTCANAATQKDKKKYDDNDCAKLMGADFWCKRRPTDTGCNKGDAGGGRREDQKDENLQKRLEEIKLKNTELSKLNETLVEKDQTITSLRKKMTKLNDILSISEKAILEKESEILTLTKKIEESDVLITQSEASSKSALEEVAFLSSELEKINNEIEVLNAALEASEKDRLTKELKIEVLGDRLNQALTSQVLELQEYRSEFFGRLKEILGERQDIRVVGDRFIFESELLFDSGSATLQEDGKYKMIEIAKTLKGITDEIPSDINWIVKVEVHTDNRPINTYLWLQYLSPRSSGYINFLNKGQLLLEIHGRILNRRTVGIRGRIRLRS